MFAPQILERRVFGHNFRSTSGLILGTSSVDKIYHGPPSGLIPTNRIDQCSVATAQGKQGIWLLTFPDRENTGNLVNLIFYTGKIVPTQGKFRKFCY